MKAYLDYLQYVLDNGVMTANRTGVKTLACSGYMLKHDMKDGFPLLTTKKMGIKNIASELEMFIKGIQDKRWLQERNNHIWDEWCNPQKVPYGNDEETKAKMLAESDLGPIYGSQWVRFNGDDDKGNQLKMVIDTIKKDPTCRRLVVSAWNPLQMDQMALPPCHVLFEVLCYPEQGTMDILWFQRSCDSFLGVPYDLASYALLLTLLCKETGYTPGCVYGMLGSCHIYENHLDVVKEQLSRPTHKLPTIEIENWTDIWEWKYSDVKLLNYESESRLVGAIAV
jgi:thymidylate synthase